jgi:hypothetical protein
MSTPHEPLLREHTGENCRYCPVCVAIGVLRGERPEVTEKLTAAGLALLSALRTAFDTATPQPAAQEPAPQEPTRPGPRPAPQSPNGRVQRIDLA